MFAGILTSFNSLFISKSDGNRSVEIGMNALAASILFVAIIAFYSFQYTIHQDLAGNLLSGKLALQLGEQYELYSIYFPPAEKLWFSLAAKLQEFSGLRSDHIVLAMSYCAVVFSVGFAYSIRKKAVGATPWFFILSLIALTILPILFRNIFGLREHLVALGLYPYLIFRLSDPTGTKISLSWRIAIGLWAGWALLFKYLYAVAILLIEVADAIIQRRFSLLFRIENLIAATIVIAYLFSWLVIKPGNLETISIMKNAVSANLIDAKLNAYYVGFSLVYAAPLFLVGLLYKADHRNMFLCLALLIGAIAVAAIQARWYAHHHFPIILTSVLLFWIIGKNATKIITVCVALLLVHSIYNEFRKSDLNQTRITILEKSFQDNNISLEKKRVALMAAYPSPFNEVIAKFGGIRWTALMNFAYVAAELKEHDIQENNDSPAPPILEFSDGRNILHDKTLRLWEDFLPDVIIMDHSTSWPLQHLQIRWPNLLSKDIRFNEILKNYELSYTHKNAGLEYQYYTRKQ
jgi:hypothetical protein